MYQTGGSLPLQGRPSGLPSAMDRQFQSRVDPRLLAQQMPSQVMQQQYNGGYPMYNGATKQQITPQQIQQMSPQMRQQYQMRQQQLQAQQQAAMIAQQQMQARTSQQRIQPQWQSQFNPAMMPANSQMPTPGMMPQGSQPQFDNNGNAIVPDYLKAENTSIHGNGNTVKIGEYNQQEQYQQAKKSRNLDPNNHMLFLYPSKCPYSSKILNYLKEANLIDNFKIVDLADPRIQAIPKFLTVVPTLYKPKERRKYVEEELKNWFITHFGDPEEAINAFKRSQKNKSQVVMPGLRSLGDISGDGNDIFAAMTDQGAPLSNNPNKHEVRHTTIFEGSLSKFDDIDKGVNKNQMATGNAVSPGDIRPSDKEDVYDPNIQQMVPEPSAAPGNYITGNPFAVKINDERKLREDQMKAAYERMQQERAQDLQMRPRQNNNVNTANKVFGY